MDATGTSLDTIDQLKPKQEWPVYLRACAERLRKLPTTLPHHVRDKREIADQLERLAVLLEHT